MYVCMYVCMYTHSHISITQKCIKQHAQSFSFAYMRIHVYTCALITHIFAHGPPALQCMNTHLYQGIFKAPIPLKELCETYTCTPITHIFAHRSDELK